MLLLGYDRALRISKWLKLDSNQADHHEFVDAKACHWDARYNIYVICILEDLIFEIGSLSLSHPHTLYFANAL